MHSGDDTNSQQPGAELAWDFRADLDENIEWELELLADELDDCDDQLAAAQIVEVQELTWAQLDQRGTPEEMRRLSGLLLSDREARAIYLECIQLHAELEETLRSAAD